MALRSASFLTCAFANSDTSRPSPWPWPLQNAWMSLVLVRFSCSRLNWCSLLAKGSRTSSGRVWSGNLWRWVYPVGRSLSKGKELRAWVWVP